MATKTTWNLEWAESGLRELARAWRDAPERPRIAPEVLDHWDDLVRWWVHESDLVLPVRSGAGTNRGSLAQVGDRQMVFVDNSPPQWIFARAWQGWVPDRAELTEAVATEMPVAQVLKAEEQARASMTRRLAQGPSTSKLGLRLHHIDAVALGKVPQDCSLEQIQAATVRLLNPRNMFVLPGSIGGLGEIPTFIDVMRHPGDRGP